MTLTPTKLLINDLLSIFKKSMQIKLLDLINRLNKTERIR
jgi:hypothetical protein